jgi:ribosomal protein S18 acetylase RimI-like enzyme
MELQYKKATSQDMEMLLKARIEMLRAVNNPPADTDFSQIEANCRVYYSDSFEKDAHVAYLVFDGDTFVGCGGVSFFQGVPSFHNPSGMRAYIVNIYTAPEYRGRGIATKVVDLLVQEAKKRDIKRITLVASDMGRPVYERYGFVQEQRAMELP